MLLGVNKWYFFAKKTNGSIQVTVSPVYLHLHVFKMCAKNK